MRLFLALLLATSAAAAAEPADRPGAARAEFKRAHPCPSGAGPLCEGWEVDRRVPLCAGGREEAGNYQWLTREQAREKNRQDAELCRTAGKPRA